MDDQPLIVLIGDSLLMEGVAISLQKNTQLGIINMDPATSEIKERLVSLQPTMVIFELERPGSDALLSLMKDQPGMLLIGLNQGCCQVVLVESNRRSMRSMQEFCQLVQTVCGEHSREVDAWHAWD